MNSAALRGGASVRDAPLLQPPDLRIRFIPNLVAAYPTTLARASR